MHHLIQAEGIVFSGEKYNLKFLLLKRLLKFGGFWEPLVAKLDDHIHTTENILKELNEAIGVKSPIKITHELWRFNWQNSEDIVHETVYGIQLDENQVIQLDNDEFMSYKWVTYDQAMVLMGRENNKKAFELFKTFISEVITV